ncbi:MAG: hypothetical protein NC483_03800 [Ruminococcus sp.]|nr:hypothetical protein [Ruminococcus sp.]
MKFEKNRNSKKYFLCGLIMVVVLTITVTFITSKANYRMTASIPLTEGKVTASPYDINIVALYLDNVEQDSNTIIPSGYKINEENSYCYKGTNKNNKDSNARVYTDELGNHSFSGISKSSKCILYLEKNPENAKTMSELLNTHYKYKSKRTSENKDFNVPYEETTYGMIFEAEDDDGITYYFAGNPLDNWVEFGGYYWRIIRINGDGSIRLIYQGRTQDENGNKLEPQLTGTETQIGTSKFNEKNDDNAYVGYMYGTASSSTYEETHENKNNSAVKQYLDNWFSNSNIKQGTSYYNKIDINASFCNDRSAYTDWAGTNAGGGTGTTKTYYGAYPRIAPERGELTSSTATVTPTLKCANSKDLYTVSTSNKGNRDLIYPIGLITADEVSYAGMIYGTANELTGTYLYTNTTYWTMTPTYNNSDNDHLDAREFMVYRLKYFTNNKVDVSYGVRPVINLRSDVTFTGNGTISNPYKVVD